MNKPAAVATALIAAVRLAMFLPGVVLMTRYGDWRQSIGYPLVVLSSLPDALLVRPLVMPNSVWWPLAITVSIVITSAASGFILARMILGKS